MVDFVLNLMLLFILKDDRIQGTTAPHRGCTEQKTKQENVTFYTVNKEWPGDVDGEAG